MHDPDLVWRFGRWVARRESGAAHLSWSDGELRLGVRRGHIVSVLGPDPGTVSRAVGSPPGGQEELLAEARAIAGRSGIPETQAVGAVKEAVQRGFAAWLLDPQRGLSLDEVEPDPTAGPTISITHALVELILGAAGLDLAAAVLPDLGVLLRRAPNFLQLYSPLRLSEEADLVVAKITGQRTGEEIATRSPHGSDEVVRLLAALVATGMLEPVPLAHAPEEAEVPAVELPEEEPLRRRLPLGWIIAAVVIVVAVLAVLTSLKVRSEPHKGEQTSASWGVVVDMGCDPEELQRVLRKAREHPNSLRPVQATDGEGSPCWRLVWGRFPSSEAATAAIGKIPRGLLLEGFTPHPVELPGEPPSPTPG